MEIDKNGNLTTNISLTRADMSSKIKIGSQTNKGTIKQITSFGHFVMDNNEVIGDWRDVIEIDDKFYFL